MTQEKVYGPVEPVVFVEKAAPRRVKLDALESGKSRIGTIVKDIPFIDYSVEPAEELVYEGTLTPVSIDERKHLIKLCTKYDRAGIPEIDFDRLDDLLMAKVFGFTESEWKEFTMTHPIGLYTKLALIAKEINCETNFTVKQLEELKNSAGQEQ